MSAAKTDEAQHLGRTQWLSWEILEAKIWEKTCVKMGTRGESR